MRTKKVNRYWCDFCNKAGLAAGSMRKHEQHCTMNPGRACRVCRMIEDGLDSDELDAKLPLAGLITMLPDPQPYHALSMGQELEDAHTALIDACAEILPTFKRAAGGCPACMLAALRLKKIPVPMMEGFNFKTEMQDVFADREPVQGRDY